MKTIFNILKSLHNTFIGKNGYSSLFFVRKLISSQLLMVSSTSIGKILGHSSFTPVSYKGLMASRYLLIFKFRLQSVASIAILSLLFITSLNVQAQVNVNENNEQWPKDVPFTKQRADKVVAGALSQQQSTAKQLLTAQVANTELKNYPLYAEQWDIARSGESVLYLPALKQIVNAWLEHRQKKIEIRYPGGEAGELWVHELTDWLVSLGIPSDQLVVIAGSGADDRVNFSLIK